MHPFEALQQVLGGDLDYEQPSLDPNALIIKRQDGHVVVIDGLSVSEYPTLETFQQGGKPVGRIYLKTSP